MRLGVLNVIFKQFNVWRGTFKTSHICEMNIYFGIKITFPAAEAKWTKPVQLSLRNWSCFFPFVLRT